MNPMIDLKDDYNRELRIHRIKRALAWCGVVVAGSLLVFCAGVQLLHTQILDVVLGIGAIGLLMWGVWGFVHLKTRH